MNSWYNAAKYCENTFGSHLDEDEGFFVCPECGEPIYFMDWAGEHVSWDICPICECSFEEEK